ncbi:MAG: DNA-binding response OmpR family regulator [Candidatus Paceibacteria bacterium]|jgi:DNA-binding response OmpR family regulator
MPHRQKILILEKDDFLREILGNLLHKEGGYLYSEFSLEEGLSAVHGNKIDTIILGTSCTEYKGKETLRYINKRLEGSQHQFFIINHTEDELDIVPKDRQMKINELSIEKIIDIIPV